MSKQVKVVRSLFVVQPVAGKFPLSDQQSFVLISNIT